MKKSTIVKKLWLDILFKKIKSTNKKEPKLQISDLDEYSEVVNIDKIGITELGQGVVIFKTDDGKIFPISAFSSDTAKIISDLREGINNEMPSIYSMLEQVCETLGLMLVKVRIYDSGQALRANLYFTGKKDQVLRNYRASDAIALATLYSIPILVKKDLLEQSPKIKS